ncbi:MAG: aminopeptidase [Anaerolineales bacterium]
MTLPNFQESLKKYADLVVNVGLNLQKGQRLLINNPSTRGVQLHAAPLVRELVASAYRAGAEHVEVLWGDEASELAKYKIAPQSSFDEFPIWQVQAVLDLIEKGGAHLTVRSNNPFLLSEEDPELVARMQKAAAQTFSPVSQKMSGNVINWCVIAASGKDWAKAVFPDLSPEQAEDKLWEAIFDITRVNLPDPVSAWKEHIAILKKRSAFLNAKQYAALKYKAPGTDLTVGLPRGHQWLSAREKTQSGIDYTANLPTEETFSMPHKDQIDGVVSASMPLAYGGTTLEDFTLTYEKGRVTKVTAKRGEHVLKKLVETDDGAASLGEVALVPHSSPIAQRGHLFLDPLIDENAASHLAIGRAYRVTMEGGTNMSEEEFQQNGGNISLVHVDFMIGSDKMDIDGIKEDGSTEPIMRQGEWAFDA